jgi:NADPH-dependent 2,4-dienoyl-CoA reductase/sulfur reductase-like enzyme
VSRDQVAVVGAGVAGLAAAEELAARGDVVVLDRLPVPGGVLAFDHPAVRALAERCGSAGVRWLLGTTAVRWDQGRLLAVGPSGVRWLDAGHLVFAGGCRPATAAELPVAGPRLAGVLPAPVAIHLAEAKVTLGRRVMIVGTGDWARAAREAIAGQRSQVTVVAGEPAEAVTFRHDALISGWAPVTVSGHGRVSALTLERAGQRHVLDCDAVILAASARPLRNVDGAIFEPAPGVTFVQPAAETGSWEEVASAARAAARQIRPGGARPGGVRQTEFRQSEVRQTEVGT